MALVAAAAEISLKSRFVPVWPLIEVVKLGQPVPLSNLADDSNSGRKHATQRKVPLRCSSFSGLENARSVSSSNRTS